MKNLKFQNEKIIYEAKAHWINFLFPALLGVFFFLLFLTGLSDKEDFMYSFLLLLFAVLSFGIPFLNIKTTHLILTDKRLYGKTGILKIKRLDIPISKVQYVNVDRSILGRILGYGDIKINALTGLYDFKKQRNPEEMQNAIMNTIN